MNTQKIDGWQYEPISCQGINTGLFAAFLEVGNVHTVVQGHDHNNDFNVTIDGISLYYGRKTGFNSIKPMLRQKGGRVYDVTLTGDENKGTRVDSHIITVKGHKYAPKRQHSFYKNVFTRQKTCRKPY